MRIFATADTHFGEPKILGVGHRYQFHDIGEHDDHLISQINTYVAREDRLIVVGDFGHEKYRHRINCKEVILIRGNHDAKIPKCLPVSMRV